MASFIFFSNFTPQTHFSGFFKFSFPLTVLCSVYYDYNILCEVRAPVNSLSKKAQIDGDSMSGELFLRGNTKVRVKFS